MRTEVSKEIPVSLKAMFDEAEKKGLWFFCNYQQLWFSPNKLREEQNNGRFRWGAVNWKLRDPKERLEQLRKTAAKATQEADEFAKLLGTTGKEVPV